MRKKGKKEERKEEGCNSITKDNTQEI